MSACDKEALVSTRPPPGAAGVRGVRVPRAELVPLVLTVTALAFGAVAAAMGLRTAADWLWGGAVAVALVPLTTGIIASLRRREPGVDVVALLAMVGALWLGELLAGAVIAVMLTGGEALERVAAARAGRELSALLAGAPRTAHRRRGDRVEEIPAEQVEVGDLLVVPPGAAVPVDGIVVSPVAVLDEAAITGESRPVERLSGERVASGAVNGGGPFDLRAVAKAEDSTYAGIVRLVREAQTAKAPFVRLADRTAGFFVPLTLVLAGAAWALAGDPRRALAVLVVATPCPLLLAAPIAIVSGISSAARRGVIVKGGAALERLAGARILLLDKTGTLTTGRPRVAEVEAFGTLGYQPEQVLRVAAALEQVSSHPFAPSIVRAARERGLTLPFPRDVAESPGAGIAGEVGGRRVAVGAADWVTAAAPLPVAARALRRRASLEGASAVFVAVDDVPVGGLLLDDPLRAEAPRALRALRRSGIERVVVVTGDQPDVAEVIGSAVGADRVLAQRTPADKVDAVKELAGHGVMMVGDGVNDAPALAAADVGVAMGARGAAASSQAADVVLTVDRLDRLPEARAIATRSRRIAWQSVLVGMGLSLVAMGFAAAGLLAPVAGALVQEAIDLAAIGNALRAIGRRRTTATSDEGLSLRFVAEHRELLGGVERIRDVADRLDRLAPDALRDELGQLRAFLVGELLPHEQAEEEQLYPELAKGDDDPTGPMTASHREIRRLVRLYCGLLDALPSGDGEAIGVEDRRELRRVLYGLHAILRLHFAEEEEAYAAMDQSWEEGAASAMLTAPRAARAPGGARGTRR